MAWCILLLQTLQWCCLKVMKKHGSSILVIYLPIKALSMFTQKSVYVKNTSECLQWKWRKWTFFLLIAEKRTQVQSKTFWKPEQNNMAPIWGINLRKSQPAHGQWVKKRRFSVSKTHFSIHRTDHPGPFYLILHSGSLLSAGSPADYFSKQGSVYLEISTF